LKSKIEKLIIILAFDEIRELNKNNNIIRKLRFISSVVVKTKSLHQFNAKVENAKVDIKINVEKANKEISTHFFIVFAD